MSVYTLEIRVSLSPARACFSAHSGYASCIKVRSAQTITKLEMGQSTSAAAADAAASHEELTVLGGSEEAHLVGVQPDAYPLTPQRASIGTKPAFDGTISQFAASAPPHIAQQMWNRARVCPQCGKACAVIMVKCNSCGSDALADAPEAQTPNVITGFIYGVAYATSPTAPLALSLRREEEQILVYDDMLARSTCHLNAVPTDVHLPDWRWLLRRPKAAKRLMLRLEAASWAAVRSR